MYFGTYRTIGIIRLVVGTYIIGRYKKFETLAKLQARESFKFNNKKIIGRKFKIYKSKRTSRKCAHFAKCCIIRMHKFRKRAFQCCVHIAKSAFWASIKTLIQFFYLDHNNDNKK